MTRRLLPLLVLALLVMPVQPALAGGDDDELRIVVVKVEPWVDLADLADDTDTTLEGALVASRGLYEFRADGDGRKDLEKADGVVWAEEVDGDDLQRSSARQSSWNDGQATQAGSADPAADRRAQKAAHQLNLSEAAQMATGAGVTVAVLDTGVDAGAIDGAVAGGWDLVDDDADPSERRSGEDTDGDGVADGSHGHGTHIAGIVTLVAPDVTIMPFRVLDAEGNGNSFVAAEAIWMAIEQGADVINISFGSSEKSDILKDAIKDAKKADVIVVAAAGNTGDDHKQYPAAYGDVIAVAAGGADGAGLSGFATRGGWIDLTAPGEDILSSSSEASLASWSGSSMAAPFVTGAAALVLEVDPDVDSGKDVVKALEKDGHKVKDGGKRPDLGRALRELVD